MRFEKFLLTEKTYNINADVDLVYNKMVKPIHKYWLNKQYDKFNQALRDTVLLGHMKSSDLKSKECKMAHELNPIDIVLMNDTQGNYYNPQVKAIHISFNSQVIDIMQQTYYNLDAVKELIGSHTLKRFLNELSESSVKGSIYHELSHWLNDSLHNRHLTKQIEKAAEHEERGQEIMAQGHENVNFTFYEIDAQIHAMKQLKRDNKNLWDEIDWEDIIRLKPSFWGVFRRAANGDEYDSYMKNLTKRMNREKLLTKKLQKFPNKREMMKIVATT